MSWLYNPSRLSKLSNSLKAKHLELASEAMGESLCSYRPWMANPADRLHVFQSCKTDQSASIVPSIASVESLKNSVFRSETEPFGKIDSLAKRFQLSTDQSEYQKFCEKTDKAMALIKSVDPILFELIKVLLVEILPLSPASVKRDELRHSGCGMSVQWYRGGIFLMLPMEREFTVEEHAINIAHELGHQALMIYQTLADLVDGDEMRTVYSAVRKTHRPAILSLHALVALSFMSKLTLSLCKQRPSPYLKLRFESLQSDLNSGIRCFSDADLTDLGNSILSEIKTMHVAS